MYNRRPPTSSPSQATAMRAVHPPASSGIGLTDPAPHTSGAQAQPTAAHEANTTTAQRPGTAGSSAQERTAAAERRVAGLRQKVSKQAEELAARQQQLDAKDQRCALKVARHCWEFAAINY